jgi:GTP-binding protein
MVPMRDLPPGERLFRLEPRFLCAAKTMSDLPPMGAPEVCFAGRSNVGKSSLVNALVGRKGLARASSEPGRTRELIFFAIAGKDEVERIRIVDLPGYGYAKVNKAERESWRSLVETYVTDTQTLKLCVVLVDARRGPEEEEGQLVEWLDSLGIPTRLLATKIDKLTAGERGLLTKKMPGVIGASGLILSILFAGQSKRPIFKVLFGGSIYNSPSPYYHLGMIAKEISIIDTAIQLKNAKKVFGNYLQRHQALF